MPTEEELHHSDYGRCPRCLAPRILSSWWSDRTIVIVITCTICDAPDLDEPREDWDTEC